MPRSRLASHELYTPQGQQRTAEQRWVRWIQRSIKKLSCVNFQFQYHERIAHKLIYMTHEPCYIWIFIIGANMRFNHTKLAIHSPGHSHILFTSARDCESAHWTLVLHIPVNLFPKCQYKTNAGSSLTMPRVRCKQLSGTTMEPAVEKPGDTCGLHVESLICNKSTCASRRRAIEPWRACAKGSQRDVRVSRSTFSFLNGYDK